MEASNREMVFLDKDGVFISNTRLSFSGTMYATANITSVSTFYKKPSRKVEFFLFLIALGLLFAGDFLFGIIAAVSSALVFSGNKNRYCVRLSSNASEKDALWSNDKGFITDIVNAINEAIIYRG